MKKILDEKCIFISISFFFFIAILCAKMSSVYRALGKSYFFKSCSLVTKSSFSVTKFVPLSKLRIIGYGGRLTEFSRSATFLVGFNFLGRGVSYLFYTNNQWSTYLFNNACIETVYSSKRSRNNFLLNLRSNSVITNTLGPDKFVRYNRVRYNLEALF